MYPSPYFFCSLSKKKAAPSFLLIFFFFIMLAWLQKQVEIYVHLGLIEPIEDLNSINDKTMACLGHRFFFQKVNLIQQVIEPNESQIYALFQTAGVNLHQSNWLDSLPTVFPEEYANATWIQTSQCLLTQRLEAYHQDQKGKLLPITTIINPFVLVTLNDEQVTLPDCLHPNLSALDAVKSALEYQQFVRNQLDFIQAKMLHTTQHTGIRNLEKEMECIRWVPSGIRARYDLISCWLKEVKIWFAEAERIQHWIEQRICRLESPAIKKLDELNREHELLEKEVDQFDQQDMARLRAHVKQLTGSSNDLSPADTTTIEITFSTLRALDRLMHLLKQRSYELQIMTLRADWEQALEKSVNWLAATSERLDIFMARTRQVGLRNQLIEELVWIETDCAVFDQGQFKTTVDLYQNLDEASHEELGPLETQQTDLEQRFERLMKTLTQARRRVEEYVITCDLVTHCQDLKTAGEQLRRERRDSTWAEHVGGFDQELFSLMARIPSGLEKQLQEHTASLVCLKRVLAQDLEEYHRACEIQRLSAWVEERIRAMDNTQWSALDKVDLYRLRKEREAQIAKLNGIRQDVTTGLEPQLDRLEQALEQRGLDLDCLENRIHWDSLYTQSMHWITQTTASTWKFIQRAQWRPSGTNSKSSAEHIQSCLADFEPDYRLTQQAYERVIQQKFMDNTHVKRRQETLDQHWMHFQHLAQFTQEVIKQHLELDAFSKNASALFKQGHTLLAIEDVLHKVELGQQIDEFAQQVDEFCMQPISYPQCDEQARSTRPSTADDGINAIIEQTVQSTHASLKELVRQLLEKYCLEQAKSLSDSMLQIKQEYSLDPESLKSKADRLTEQYKPLIRRIENLGSYDIFDRLRVAHSEMETFVKCYPSRHHWESLLAQGSVALKHMNGSGLEHFVQHDLVSLETAYKDMNDVFGGTLQGVEKRQQEIREEVNRLRQQQWTENQKKQITDDLENIHVPKLIDTLSGMLRQSQVEGLFEKLAKVNRELTTLNDHELREARNQKQRELEGALEIGRFLTAADDLEKMQSSLEEAIGKSGILMNRLSRNDLQTKLTQLDARFASYDNKMTDMLKTAQDCVMSNVAAQGLASDHLSGIEKRWQDLKRQYKTRKIELGQKDRARKSSLPTRTPKKQSSVYVADPKNDLDMEIGRIVNNAPYQVKIKMVPGEVGRYWFGHLNPKLAYCRVLKSKMVMVRVGGGWAELSQFLRDHALLEGDFIPKTTKEPNEGFIQTRKANPTIKLPTPSNSQKLSQKHTQKLSPSCSQHHSQNLLSPSYSQKLSPSYSQKLSPNYSQRLSSHSSSRLPTISRSFRSSTPSRSVSSTSGYKQGDTFITMDEHGNQHEVKMRRFSNKTLL